MTPTIDDFKLADEESGTYYIQEPTLKKLLVANEKARKWDELENSKTHEALIEYIENKILRERIEKRIEELKAMTREDRNEWIIEELEKLLEGSKKCQN